MPGTASTTAFVPSGNFAEATAVAGTVVAASSTAAAERAGD
jgi:hypothetical protein